jgi:flavin-dependent dehydrogenase
MKPEVYSLKTNDQKMYPEQPSALRVDAAVVGGGPAGAIFAQLLARAGAQVTVVDRGGIGVTVVEMLSGQCRRLVEQHAAAALPPGVNNAEIVQTVSLWDTPTPVTWSTMFNPWGSGLAIARSPFDEALREAARNEGATVLAHTEVRDIERQHSGWLLHLYRGRRASTLSADFLVLASGRAGRNFVGRKQLIDHAQIALMASLPSMPAVADNSFYLEAVQDGWWYAMPNPNGGIFVGFCTEQTKKVRRRSKPLQVLWSAEMRRTRLISELVPRHVEVKSLVGRWAGVRSFDKVSGEGWIAIGDAAFAPDPLSGKGIELGINSAALGALALSAENRTVGLADYEAEIAEYVRQHESARNLYVTQAGWGL